MSVDERQGGGAKCPRAPRLPGAGRQPVGGDRALRPIEACGINVLTVCGYAGCWPSFCVFVASLLAELLTRAVCVVSVHVLDSLEPPGTARVTCASLEADS